MGILRAHNSHIRAAFHNSSISHYHGLGLSTSPKVGVISEGESGILRRRIGL